MKRIYQSMSERFSISRDPDGCVQLCRFDELNAIPSGIKISPAALPSVAAALLGESMSQAFAGMARNLQAGLAEMRKRQG